MLAPQKESIFGCSCRLWLLSWRRARVFARSCSLLSKYLPISWKQRKEQSHAQCHVTHRIRIFDKISEHVKVAKSVDIAVPELAVTRSHRTRRERLESGLYLRLKKRIVFKIVKMGDHVIFPPPRYTLLGISPPPKKNENGFFTSILIFE